MITVPIAITARNEARNILALLTSLRRSVAVAESELSCRFEYHLILNDNNDHTEQLVAGQPDVRVWHTSGGLVAAQRSFIENHTATAPFVLFSDADILVDPPTVAAVTRVMLREPTVQLAYAEKYPVTPLRRTLLARALYFYNLREGYQTRRNYMNGQFFAIRHWNIPRAEHLTWPPSANNRFLHLEAGIRGDDIFLSRDILQRFGPEAIRCVPEGIRYRPPETMAGMYYKYQRMVLEIERLHCYFPESKPAHQKWGRRTLDNSLLSKAPLKEKLYYQVFQTALFLCKCTYSVQRLYYSRFSATPCPTWQPIHETKERLD